MLDIINEKQLIDLGLQIFLGPAIDCQDVAQILQASTLAIKLASYLVHLSKQTTFVGIPHITW